MEPLWCRNGSCPALTRQRREAAIKRHDRGDRVPSLQDDISSRLHVVTGDGYGLALIESKSIFAILLVKGCLEPFRTFQLARRWRLEIVSPATEGNGVRADDPTTSTDSETRVPRSRGFLNGLNIGLSAARSAAAAGGPMHQSG